MLSVVLQNVLLCFPESETSVRPWIGVLSGESFLLGTAVLSHARQHGVGLICLMSSAGEGTQLPLLPSHTDAPAMDACHDAGRQPLGRSCRASPDSHAPPPSPLLSPALVLEGSPVRTASGDSLTFWHVFGCGQWGALTKRLRSGRVRLGHFCLRHPPCRASSSWPRPAPGIAPLSPLLQGCNLSVPSISCSAQTAVLMALST